MIINDVQSKVNDLREYRRMVEDLEAEITAIQDSIKAHMTAAGVDELAGADYKISWKPVTTSRLDSKALKAALPDVFSAYSRESISRRFTIA